MRHQKIIDRQHRIKVNALKDNPAEISALMLPRAKPLVRHLPILDDESFRSYLDRLAAFHRVTLSTLNPYVGLSRTSGFPTDRRAFGIQMDERTISEFANTTKVSTDAIRKLLLYSYHGRVLNLLEFSPGGSMDARKASVREWAYFSGSHFCPQCLHENEGAWFLRWKLPWTFACTVHKALLFDTCPSCEQRSLASRSNGTLLPAYFNLVPDPITCQNPLGAGQARVGKAARPCGYDLSSLMAHDISSHERLIRTQDLITSKFSVSSDIDETTIFFQELRSVTALVLYCAESADLGNIPDFSKTKFDSYAIKRNLDISERISSKSGKKGIRDRAYFRTPQSTSIMAAVLPTALEIVTASDKADIAFRFAPLRERISARSHGYRWQLSEYFRFTPRLSKGLAENFRSTAKFDRRIGFKSDNDNDELLSKIKTNHIPELFPEYLFSPLSGYLKGMHVYLARRFCSLSLVKLLGGITWAEAAVELGLPPKQTAKRANADVSLLNKNNCYDLFGADLRLAAIKLSSAPLVDYAQRRNLLAGFDDIPNESWVTMCANAGISTGVYGVRSKYASVWLWSELTGSHWHAAPGLLAFNKESGREVFRAFTKSHLAPLRPFLEAYGTVLLSKLNVE